MSYDPSAVHLIDREVTGCRHFMSEEAASSPAYETLRNHRVRSPAILGVMSKRSTRGGNLV